MEEHSKETENAIEQELYFGIAGKSAFYGGLFFKAQQPFDASAIAVRRWLANTKDSPPEFFLYFYFRPSYSPLTQSSSILPFSKKVLLF